MLNVFLDLEGTIVEEWSQFPRFLTNQCLDIKKCVEGLEAFRPDVKFFLFSFAVCSEEDKENFDSWMKADICKELNIPSFSKIITVPEMQEASEKLHKMRFFDVSDFICLRGKNDAFHDWCHVHRAGEFNFLIDDVVPNRNTNDLDTGTIVSTINVKGLSNNNTTRGKLV